MYWIPLLVFIAHMAEEYPRFPQWATRHFGATSIAWYTYSHIILVALVTSICWWADASSAQTWGPLFALATMWSLACNAAFHIGTTWRFREYSPGVVTGTLLLLPATAYMLWRIIDNGLLTPAHVVVAVAIGTILQVGVIASLWLRMDIGWTLRRNSPDGAAGPAAIRPS